MSSFARGSSQLESMRLVRLHTAALPIAAAARGLRVRVALHRLRPRLAAMDLSELRRALQPPGASRAAQGHHGAPSRLSSHGAMPAPRMRELLTCRRRPL